MKFRLFRAATNKSKNKVVFLHVPKTGGSTFVGLLKDSIKLSKSDSLIPTHIIDQIGNVYIKHIDFSNEERRFQYPSIFNGEFEQGTKVFMLLRDPVERIISEFNFQFHLLNGKNGNKNAAIISKLNPTPKTISDYIKFPQTQNYQTKFLLGRKIADPKQVSQAEFEKVVNGIKNIPIYCGITEEYSRFLSLFQNQTGIKLKNKITVRKKTPKDLKFAVSDSLKNRIIELNKYDYELFNYVKANLNISNLKDESFSFDDKGFVI
jgi:hypothetical protein